MMTFFIINVIILLFICSPFVRPLSEGSKPAAAYGLLVLSNPAVRLTQRVLLPNRYELNKSPQAGGEKGLATDSSKESVTFLPFLFLTFLPNFFLFYFPSLFLPTLPFLSLIFIHFLSFSPKPSHFVQIRVKVPRSLTNKGNKNHHVPSSTNHCQHDHFCFDDSCSLSHHTNKFEYLPSFVIDGTYYLVTFIRLFYISYSYLSKNIKLFFNYFYDNYYFTSEYDTFTYFIPRNSQIVVLKQHVASSLGIPSNHIRLIYSGLSLSNENVETANPCYA
jgi:hypothetical protein